MREDDTTTAGRGREEQPEPRNDRHKSDCIKKGMRSQSEGSDCELRDAGRVEIRVNEINEAGWNEIRSRAGLPRLA